MFRNLTILFAGAVFAIGCAQGQNLSAQDKKFVETAAKGGMEEVHMGHLAVDRGSSAAVKTFGQRMIDDHGKGNTQLEGLAKQKGITLPADDSQKVMSMPMAKLSGSAFDKAYAKDMVEDHKKDIAEFEKEAKSGTDADIKKWANDTLPTLRDHLRQAESLK